VIAFLYELLTGRCWHQYTYFPVVHKLTVPFQSKFLQQKYGHATFLHRKCIKCQAEEFRTRLPTMHCGNRCYDPNEWRLVRPTILSLISDPPPANPVAGGRGQNL
jgi:hypothetical protein